MIFPRSTMLPCSRPLTDQCLNPIRRAKRSFWEAFGQDHNLDRPAKRFHWDPLFQPAKKRRLSGLEEYFARIRENTPPPFLMPPPVPLRELIEKFPLSNKSRCFGSEAEQPPQIPIEVVVHDNSPKNTEGQKFVSNIIKRLYSGVKLNCDEARNTEYEARNTEFRKTGDYEQCPMCLKNDGHSPVGCPYSVCVPKVDGKPVPVGPGCDIVCRACGGQACFDDHGWDVRAVGKRCFLCCSSFDHWAEHCPNKLSGMEAYEALNLKLF